ncbi:MAG TPA: hypothetical protein VD997_14415 [Phycisphaerales bacterium]|nr:hypothetical protein [Phycisphaerales bacterium]
MNSLLSSAIILSTLAGTTLAQTVVSGLEHTATGGAVLGTPNGRRLPVHNLGSSGQDGVELRLHSSMGGGTGVEIAPVLSVAGGGVRIRHKGWDGLIYGNHRMISSGNGTGTFHWDFSSLGASSINIKVLSEDGTITEDYDVSGPIAAKPWVPNFTCPNGGTPVLIYKWMSACNGCPPFLWMGWACMTSTGETGTYTYQGRMMITPTSGPGSPPISSNIDSMLVSAIGVPSLTLTSATIETLGVSSFGLGQAHIGEVCDDNDGDGSCDERRLPVHNLGSSGQDGVSLDLGPGADGVEARAGAGQLLPRARHPDEALRRRGLRGPHQPHAARPHRRRLLRRHLQRRLHRLRLTRLRDHVL